MEEIKELASSPAFWFSSVAMAFIISMLAAFAKDWTEKVFVLFSNKRRLKALQRVKEIDEKVEQLKNNPNLLSTYQADIVFQKLRQVLYYLLSYFCMFLGIHNYLNGMDSTAISFAILSVITVAIPVRIVSQGLSKLIIIVNLYLNNRDHFVG